MKRSARSSAVRAFREPSACREYATRNGLAHADVGSVGLP
jgi:hypothetical protein